jgi:hypothetical protein
MFEDQQKAVQELLANNETFRNLHEEHQALKSKVRDADTGVTPMDAFALERSKKEKLLLKDKMAAILNTHLKQR